MEKLQIFVGLSGDTPVCHTYTTTPGTYAGQVLAPFAKLFELLELHLLETLPLIFKERFNLKYTQKYN